MKFYGENYSNFIKQDAKGVANVVHCAGLCGANEANCKGYLYDVNTLVCSLINFQNVEQLFSLNSFSGYVDYGMNFNNFFGFLLPPIKLRQIT